MVTGRNFGLKQPIQKKVYTGSKPVKTITGNVRRIRQISRWINLPIMASIYLLSSNSLKRVTEWSFTTLNLGDSWLKSTVESSVITTISMTPQHGKAEQLERVKDMNCQCIQSCSEPISPLKERVKVGASNTVQFLPGLLLQPTMEDSGLRPTKMTSTS